MVFHLINLMQCDVVCALHCGSRNGSLPLGQGHVAGVCSHNWFSHCICLHCVILLFIHVHRPPEVDDRNTCESQDSKVKI